jgi:hypothetical protein
MTRVRLCVLVSAVLLTACGDDAASPEDFVDEGDGSTQADAAQHSDGGIENADASSSDAAELGGDADVHEMGDAGAAADSSATDAAATAPHMKDVFDGVIKAGQCQACHPGVEDSADFSSIDKTYATLVTNTAIVCNGKPFVTPGNVQQSFLWDLISQPKPGCGYTRMPDGLEELSSDKLSLVHDWIRGGAQR